MDFDKALDPGGQPVPPAPAPLAEGIPSESQPEAQIGLQIGDPLDTPPNTPPDEQFLQIILNGDLPLLLPGTNLVEIMKLAIGQVVPMFHMAPWVMGVYNWRGDMLWIADLGHFFGLPPWYQQVDTAPKHTVVVIKTPSPLSEPGANSPTVGLVVSQIDGIVTYPLDALQPVADPEAIAPALAPFIQHLCRPGPGAALPVLDALALLSAMARPHD